MAITVVLNQKLKPEHADMFAQQMQGLLAETRGQEGCIDIHGYRNEGDLAHFVIIEQWQSRAHHEAYVAWRRSTGSLAKFADALQEAPSVAYLSQIA